MLLRVASNLFALEGEREEQRVAECYYSCWGAYLTEIFQCHDRRQTDNVVRLQWERGRDRETMRAASPPHRPATTAHGGGTGAA